MSFGQYFSLEEFQKEMAPPKVEAFDSLAAFRLSMQDTALEPVARAQQKTDKSFIKRSFDTIGLVGMELIRYQKGLFAGFNNYLEGGTISDSFDTAKDEIVSGFGTGNFKRNLDFMDVMRTGLDIDDEELEAMSHRKAQTLSSFIGFPVSEKFQLQATGFAGDIVIDPINALPITNIFRLAGYLIKGGGGVAGKMISKIPVAGPMKDRIVKAVVAGFAHPERATAAGKAADSAIIQADSLTAEASEQVVDNFVKEGRAWSKLATEAGKTEAELGEFVTELAGAIKVSDPKALPEALGDTYARIYRDGGLEGWDNFVNNGGLRKLPDELPIRLAIHNNLYNELNPALKQAMDVDPYNDLRNVVFEMKERQLERFVFQRQNVKRTSDVVDPVFESLTKDYVRIAATETMRDAVELLGLGPKTASGFGLNPFSSSNLHSSLQAIGVTEANRLLRTARDATKYPGQSSFFVKHATSNERVYLPIMDQGFHTDPRIIDGVREMYARRAVESSNALADLVRGYGEVLPATMEVQVVKKGAKVFKRNGEPLMKTVDTFQKRTRTVIEKNIAGKPAGVGREFDAGKVQAGPGLSATKEVVDFKLTEDAARVIEERGMILLKDVHGFENAILPQEAADIVHGVGQWQRGTLDKVLKPLDTLQNAIWKPITLFLFPGYHTRNIVSNTFFQAMMGMDPEAIIRYNARASRIMAAGSHPNRYRRARDVVKDFVGTDDALSSRKIFQRETKTGIVERGVPLSDEAVRLDDLIGGIRLEDLPGKDDLALLHLFTQLGAVRSGQAGSGEILRNLEAALATAQKAKGFLGTVKASLTGLTVNTSPLISTGAELASMIEDTQRMAATLWAMENKGMSIYDASRFAIRHMVEFNRMTNFEREVLRKGFIPFYSFARNATPLVAESLIQEPQKWRMMQKVFEAQRKRVEEQDGLLPDRLLPEYVAKGLGIPILRDPDTGEYRFRIFDSWVPMALLTDIDSWSELKQFVPNNLGPLLKTPMEILFQESLFLEKEFGLGNRTFVGRRLPQNAITIMRNLRLLQTADWYTSAETSRETREAFVRFMTGFNTVRVTRQRAGAATKARIAKMERQTASAILNAVRMDARGEIPGLVQDLIKFAKRGRR